MNKSFASCTACAKMQAWNKQSIYWLKSYQVSIYFHCRSYYNEIGAYAQSKASQIMFTTILDEKLVTENIPVKCYAMHPGFIKSNLYTQNWYSKLTTLATGFLFKVTVYLYSFLILFASIYVQFKCIVDRKHDLTLRIRLYRLFCLIQKIICLFDRTNHKEASEFCIQLFQPRWKI